MSIEELDFDPYIRKLQQLTKFSNIEVSQVEEFMVNNYDSSKVSTEIPLVPDRKRTFAKKHLLLDDSSSHMKEVN